MKYAVYLASLGACGPWDVDSDHFCVLNDLNEVKAQVEEFRSWEEEDDIDCLSHLRLGALMMGDPVTLKGALLAICIRPIV
jgi:hypothetical protein